MWMPEVAVSEKVLRAVIVYGFLLLMFRLTGKRQVGQLTPFDFVVLLIISNILQNASIGKDDSLGGGLVGALAIFFVNGLLARLTFHSRWLERLIDGLPTFLVRDGEIDERAMRAELVTRADLHAALREHGIAAVGEARFAALESTGKITAGARRSEEDR
jgi:uncharacterized membrane protein YcaP (DUF421 family)